MFLHNIKIACHAKLEMISMVLSSIVLISSKGNTEKIKGKTKIIAHILAVDLLTTEVLRFFLLSDTYNDCELQFNDCELQRGKLVK